MNTQSNAIPQSPVQSQVIAPVAIPWTQVFYWSVRRELWEYRSLYIAPLAVAVLFLLGFLISMIHFSAKLRAASTLSPMKQHDMLMQPYDFAALLLMGTTLIVAVFYCLDALYGERRDRSILFWKSLPVSDFTTVLSKAAIPIVVLPLITFAVTIVTQSIMLLLHSAAVAGSGLSVGMLWAHVPIFEQSPMLFFHLLALHGFYYAPFYGWFLLVSGWARRAPMLWAVLPLLAVGVAEKIAFNTTHIARLLGSRVSGSADSFPFPPSAADPMSMTELFHVGRFIVSPGLWIGLALCAAFLAAATRLRRYQGPI